MGSSREVLVIGGGPAGVVAARVAARAGASVTVVSDGGIGGRAGWHSLLPSKVWLAAADAVGSHAQGTALGLESGMVQATPQAILARIRETTKAWNVREEESLRTLGVDLVQGTASFIAPDEIRVESADGDPVTIHTDKVIVAAGSVPIFPPDMKPDGTLILAPRFASHLERIPESIVVVGAGPTGSEFAYLFNRLGARVTWVVDQYGVLPMFIPAAGRRLQQAMEQRGVQIVTGQTATRIAKRDEGVSVILEDGTACDAAKAFVAIGRRPDLARLGLGAISLAKDGPPEVDEFGRSAVKSVYFVGDAAGGPMLANRSMAQAAVAGSHAAGAPTLPFDPNTVVAAVYTQPQVAQIGALDGAVRTTSLEEEQGLYAHLHPGDHGFVELAFDRESRQLVGAAAVSAHAADMMAPIAMAIQQAASIDDLASVFAAHPSASELPFAAARLA